MSVIERYSVALWIKRMQIKRDDADTHHQGDYHMINMFKLYSKMKKSNTFSRQKKDAISTAVIQ